MRATRCSRPSKGRGWASCVPPSVLLAPRSLRTLVASELPRSGSTDAIILTKTNARSPMHRAGYMDYIGVLKFDDKGRPVAEQRFLGLFSSNAYMAHPQHVPLVREKCEAVMNRSGLKRDSHSGKALRHILDTLPREELFQCSTDELYALSMGLLELAQRTRTRLFIRRDSYGRFFSCLVYIPRDRFNTSVRERVENVLRDAFHGEHVDSAVLMGEAALVRLHVVVRPRIGDHPVYDATGIEAQIVSIARNWYDELRDRLIETAGEQQGIILANRYGKSLPAGYVDEVSPQVAAADVRALAGLDGPDAISMSFYHPSHRPEELRFKVYRSGSDIALSEVLPQLENLGLRVLTEHMYEVKQADGSLYIQDFEVQPVGRLAFEVEQVGTIFEDAFEQIWRGNAENDGFNRLVLGAKLGWRQVAILRSYCKYLLQTGVAFSQAYMEDALNRYPAIAGLIVELFNVRFDPRRESLGGAERERAESLLSHEMHALMDPETLAAQPGLIGNLVASLSLRAPSRRRWWKRRSTHCSTTCPASTKTASCAASSRWSTRRCARISSRPGTARSARTSASSSIRTRCRTWPSRCRSARSSSMRRAWKVSTCASVLSPAVACAGPIAARISAPRCSAWSRRRW